MKWLNILFDRSSRRAIWFIGCIFIIIGLLALFAMITGLVIAFGSEYSSIEYSMIIIFLIFIGTTSVGQSSIESRQISFSYIENNCQLHINK